MSIIKKVWILKRIDELGNCYHTLEISNYVTRNKFIREWIGDDTV